MVQGGAGRCVALQSVAVFGNVLMCGAEMMTE